MDSEAPPFKRSSPKIFSEAFAGRRVWISGVSGFKGSWIAEWLLTLGAEVHGFSLEAPTNPSLFEQAATAARIRWTNADLRDADAVAESVRSSKPDFVFHLGAQPLVRLAYQKPVETYTTNVLGTIHVMEALRPLTKPCTAILITTDKCYENREWLNSYREGDALGGYDPYSSSKAACEIAIASWRRSFFHDHPVKMFSVRAGNVIGGGDWALDRIVPDCIRNLQKCEKIAVRNKTATRPWQHVLEPLAGYLALAAAGAAGKFDSQLISPNASASAFNFGPSLEANRTVAELVIELLKSWPGEWIDQSDPNAPHEAGKLNLANDKAFHLLGWQPQWDFETTIRKTIEWYRESASCSTPRQIAELTQRQIAEYSQS